MFSDVLFPLQITVAVYAAILLLLIISYLAKKLSISQVMSAIGIMFILLVPGCIGVSFVVDEFRYGKFEFENGSQIQDEYVVPPVSSKNITMFRYHGNSSLRFTCEYEILLSWVKGDYTKYGKVVPDGGFITDHSKSSARNDDNDSVNFEKDRFDMLLKNTGWVFPEKCVTIEGPRSDRGGGYIIWYSPKEQTAFLFFNSW